MHHSKLLVTKLSPYLQRIVYHIKAPNCLKIVGNKKYTQYIRKRWKRNVRDLNILGLFSYMQSSYIATSERHAIFPAGELITNSVWYFHLNF
jgi:hypothetical protein